MSDDSGYGASEFNQDEYYSVSEKSFDEDDDKSFQSKLKERLLIFTQVPQYVYEAIDKNNREPSDLSMKLRNRLGVSSFTDFIDRFNMEIEQRVKNDGFEKFSGPVCGIISSQLKHVLCLDTIDDFLTPDPAEVRHKFEKKLLQKQRSDFTSVIQIFGSLNPKLKIEHDFFIWMCIQLCRITINYDEVGCDKNYKCIALVSRQEKKNKKKKEKKYWILLGLDNALTISDSQGEKEGTPIPVDLFSFSRKQSKHKNSKDSKDSDPPKKEYEMNIHQIPSTIKTKFDVDLINNRAFDRQLWEYDCLRVKKVPFFRSLGYHETKYHPAYIEAASRCILHPLALILRAIFSYDENHDPFLDPSKCDEVFKSFFDLYLAKERAHEMINVMVVEGLLDSIYLKGIEMENENKKSSIFPMYGIDDANNRTPTQNQITNPLSSKKTLKKISSKPSISDQNPKKGTNSTIADLDQALQNAAEENDITKFHNENSRKSFLTFFTLWFLERYSNNYFNRVVCNIVNEIDLHPSLEEKNVDEAINLIKYFVDTITNNDDQISPQIHHFASVLQNFVVVQWDKKLNLYLILKEFFFDLYVYRMIKEPRFWDNKYTLPNQSKRTPEEIKKTANDFIKMIDIFLSPDKRIELEYEVFSKKTKELHSLQEKMFRFIMRLPVLTLDHCYNQDVSVLQQQNAVTFILMIISENPKLFQYLIKKKETKLVNTPIFYSVAHFIRCLVSDKENYGLLEADDRKDFKANFLAEESSSSEKNRNDYEEEEELQAPMPEILGQLPSSIQSIGSSGGRRRARDRKDSHSRNHSRSNSRMSNHGRREAEKATKKGADLSNSVSSKSRKLNETSKISKTLNKQGSVTRKGSNRKSHESDDEVEVDVTIEEEPAHLRKSGKGSKLEKSAKVFLSDSDDYSIKTSMKGSSVQKKGRPSYLPEYSDSDFDDFPPPTKKIRKMKEYSYSYDDDDDSARRRNQKKPKGGNSHRRDEGSGSRNSRRDEDSVSRKPRRDEDSGSRKLRRGKKSGSKLSKTQRNDGSKEIGKNDLIRTAKSTVPKKIPKNTKQPSEDSDSYASSD